MIIHNSTHNSRSSAFRTAFPNKEKKTNGITTATFFWPRNRKISYKVISSTSSRSLSYVSDLIVEGKCMLQLSQYFITAYGREIEWLDKNTRGEGYYVELVNALKSRYDGSFSLECFLLTFTDMDLEVWFKLRWC